VDTQAMAANMFTLHRKQKGVSLIELMVSMAAGLIVVGGVTSVYVSTIKSSSDTLSHSKLNQELTTLLNIMTADIRRAGIWQGSMDYMKPQNNIFSSEAISTKLTVVDQANGSTIINPFNTTAWSLDTDGDCILYSYDRTTAGTVGLGTVEDTDVLGFRLSTNPWVVQIRTQRDATFTGTDQCDQGTWLDLTDSELLRINTLSFDLGNSACINTSADSGSAEYDCYAVAPNAGDVITETREVDITINASLTNDAFVSRTMEQSVRVRNDHVTVVGP
jgi:prepilin-type N-terminal cleavage/methylation domain-containing protein